MFATPEPLGDDFRGRVRLFPLPNLVVFPGVVQPLHVFEPRYRELLADALAGDRLIAMARLAPGWEQDYDGRPEVLPAVCVGRILTHALLEDGRSNLLLLGVQRAIIRQEMKAALAYREATVDILRDRYPPVDAEVRLALRRRLIEAIRPHAPRSEEAKQQLEKLFQADVPLGLLTDIFAHAMPLDLDLKQKLLGECDVDHRARMMLAASAAWKEPIGLPYPPEFSEN